VVAAARSEEGLRRAAKLGADATVQLTGDDADALKAASDGGYDIVLDPLWGAPAVAAIGAMKPFGKLVALGQSAAAEAKLASVAVRARPVDILGYTNYTPPADVLRAGYEALAGHAAAGRIDVAIERLGLDDVPAAWKRQASSPHAKLVIEPAR